MSVHAPRRRLASVAAAIATGSLLALSATPALAATDKPSQLAVAIPGTTRGMDLTTGETTCFGGTWYGTSCDTERPEHSALTVMAMVDAPLPPDWSLSIVYDDGTGDKAIPCTARTSVSCTATVMTPYASQASGVLVRAYITTPRGWNAATLGVTLTR